MICGVGIDSIEISRISKLMESQAFIQKTFSQTQLDEFNRYSYKAQTVAAAFCAKEAFGKAIKTGVLGFSWTDVSVLHDENSAPYLVLENRAKQLAQGLSFEISITHTNDIATCIVIAYKK